MVTTNFLASKQKSHTHTISYALRLPLTRVNKAADSWSVATFFHLNSRNIASLTTMCLDSVDIRRKKRGYTTRFERFGEVALNDILIKKSIYVLV